MRIFIATLRFLAVGTAMAGLIYLQYRYARWNWERRNKDMRANVQTIFNGRK